MAISSGKYAKFISDRSGMEFPYTEMVIEWNGSRVHISEFESKHPQIQPKAHSADAQGLRNARPARTADRGFSCASIRIPRKLPGRKAKSPSANPTMVEIRASGLNSP